MRKARSTAVAALGLLLAFAGSAAAFDPIVSYGENPSIRLELIGRYTGGIFSRHAVQTPPGYDPDSHRLYVGSAIRRQVELVNIKNPYLPKKDRSVELRVSPSAVAFANRILAVAIHGPEKSARGAVLFFDEDGDPAAPPVTVGVQPSMLAFTPDRRRILVTNTGEASDDYREDPEGSVSIIRLRERWYGLDPDVSTIRFREWNTRRTELRRAGVRLLGPGATVAQDLEPESVAVAPDGRRAYVTFQRNNAIGVIDLGSERLVAIHALGFKNHALARNAIDASPADGRINIRSWPLRSWYQPDQIAFAPTAAGPVLVTANEGDPRDFGPFMETKRVAELILDPVRFPDAASLQQPENLGRLRVSRFEGDFGRDGDYDALYAIGSRSFALWSTDGQLLFDSGSQFERITAAAAPSLFNAADDANSFDSKSELRGPEPEALAAGRIGTRTYAFIAFERIGGVIAYDITKPAAPRFQQYINNRNPFVDPARECVKDKPQPPACAAVGDLSPEGVLFIPAKDSPIGVALLVLTHETSDSVAIFRVDATGW
jgi:2',3'-cyclic-nucleotide 2'-phosphodiesterase / 3'-nucleotidase / 5'-nucleotidase